MSRIVGWSGLAYLGVFHSPWALYVALCLLFIAVNRQADINRRNGLR